MCCGPFRARWVNCAEIMLETEPVTKVPIAPRRTGAPSARSVPSGYGACAVVDLDAVEDNVATLRAAASGAQVMAVVKADGYGHGMAPVAAAALRAGADWLGTAQVSEALGLRAAGVRCPVLAWVVVPGDRFADAAASGVDVGISALWALEEAADGARDAGTPIRLHLKVDTGLHRNGCLPRDLPDLVAAAGKYQAEGLVDVVGVFSHLACADIPGHPSVAAQISCFAEAVELVERAGACLEIRHLANSAAALALPEARFDAVRPGLAVYGLSPMPESATSAELGLRPSMSLVGRVVMVKDVAAGAGVSYGHTHVTSAPTTLAVLPLGYGDGLPRHGSAVGPVLLGGRRVSVAGRVCMDQTVLDLGGRTDSVQVGDTAVLFGSGEDGEPTAQDWADAIGTISYEIVTRVGTRVPRRYVGRGRTPPEGRVGTLAPGGRGDGSGQGGTGVRDGRR
jgi:alanine racemase